MIDLSEGARVSGFRVIKKLATTARGAIKLSRRFGDAMVCVRYRVDAEGLHRYTTVELVVEKALIRRTGEMIVEVKASLFKDLATLRFIKEAGAIWDSSAKLWRMRRDVALTAGLRDQIVRR